jgi:hypothetical protein
MTEVPYTHPTSISPIGYIEDYLKHYSQHRCVVVEKLLENWDVKNSTERVILGSRVLMEYGASTEEFFAFTYAIHKQCNVTPDVKREDREVFFKHLFEYRHFELWEFIKANNFENWIERQFCLPARHEMAKQMGYSERDYLKLLSDAEISLECQKDAFFVQGFKDIYNKLKHPFLALAPGNMEDTGELVLPVLTRSTKASAVAKVEPVVISLDYLEEFRSDIRIMSETIKFLLGLFLSRYLVQNSK